jgi:SAM-dependent methyltransferase
MSAATEAEPATRAERSDATEAEPATRAERSISMSAAPPGRVRAERFERLYEASPDPWGYCTSDYERAKYADTLAALAEPSYGLALEIGCSIGVFTGLLAERCERLVALDFSTGALSLARERLRGVRNVELVRASFPEETPPGSWELVVCSEVLYYLDRPTFARALEWLRAQLENGSTVVVVSWRGAGGTEPLTGDEVHDLLESRLAPWHALDARKPGCRLDRFDGHAR